MYAQTESLITALDMMVLHDLRCPCSLFFARRHSPKCPHKITCSSPSVRSGRDSTVCSDGDSLSSVSGTADTDRRSGARGAGGRVGDVAVVGCTDT